MNDSLFKNLNHTSESYESSFEEWNQSLRRAAGYFGQKYVKFHTIVFFYNESVAICFKWKCSMKNRPNSDKNGKRLFAN